MCLMKIHRITEKLSTSAQGAKGLKFDSDSVQNLATLGWKSRVNH
jgi:hypothetical protein